MGRYRSKAARIVKHDIHPNLSNPSDQILFLIGKRRHFISPEKANQQIGYLKKHYTGRMDAY